MATYDEREYALSTAQAPSLRDRLVEMEKRVTFIQEKADEILSRITGPAPRGVDAPGKEGPPTGMDGMVSRIERSLDTLADTLSDSLQRL